MQVVERNPEHLFLGTQSDNINDSVAKGRQIGNTILTTREVEEIRNSNLRARELADLYHVSVRTIFKRRSNG